MKFRPYQTLFGRRNGSTGNTLWVVCIIALNSIFFNIYFIYNPPKLYNSWASATKDEDMLKVMQYIELEREMYDRVRDEPVDTIWQCMRDDYLSALRESKYDVSKFEAFSSSRRTISSSRQSNRSSTLAVSSDDQLRQRFLDRKPIVDLNDDDEYLVHSKDACAHGNVDVLIVSPSAPANFDRRREMRLGSVSRFVNNAENRAKLLFFTGKPTATSDSHSQVQPATKTQQMINMEHSQYRDIVQSTFVDTYKNITRKSLFMLKWSTTFCPKAEILLRLDDDVEANVSAMVSAVKETRRKYSHFILGVERKGMKTCRDKTSKYLLSYGDFPYTPLPDFLLGGSLGYQMKTAKLVLEACRRYQPVLSLDDVWVTGICARRVLVPAIHSPAFYFTHHGSRFE